MLVLVPVRWGDQDPYGHVNNAQMLRILEEARMRGIWGPSGAVTFDPGASDGRSDGQNRQDDMTVPRSINSNTMTVVARHEIDYLRPTMYQLEPLQVEMKITRLGGASIDMYYEVWPDDDRVGRPLVRAVSVFVLVSTKTGRSRRMSNSEREYFRRYMD
ncbi:acyl-CoA thioesterase [Tropheryma whipplei]|uniref:Uncharacterized protein n=1 Tax=Tropheryma whipplei (strain Twist) TaxID=203267 RepID=Q83GB2_TROWT|nr:thioesterase family protein [Tropheryma whipplei]AAO44497.1 unknown [Tropheryma whipplei str. Twist]MCO8182339.1 acyl-CoA thioesterase [Tropheryma whipplei]MCO8190108.1 acyl-CoA thioesterase [Tropheryma whipplei]CAD67041.1 hypothetical protein TW370 [Tropheryma whipplei TW08/27]